MDEPDLNWNWPPETGPILDAHGRALFNRLGLLFGLLDPDFTDRAGAVIAVRADETGVEWKSPGELGVNQVGWAIIELAANTTLNTNHAAVRINGQTLVFQHLLARSANGTTALTITLPNNAPPGLIFEISQHASQTATVTITPQTGATIDGDTASVTLDGPRASASFICVRNANNASAEYLAKGEISLPQVFTGLTTFEAVRGAYPLLRPAITGNVTLSTDDRGTERRITATSSVTITVPSGFVGRVALRNVSSANHTVAFPGNVNRTIPAGTLGVIDCNGTENWLFIASPASS